MTDLRFEIYPGATPTSGLLATFNADDYEEGSGLRQELNGTGSGQLVVHGSHIDVTAANFTRGNYVKVIDLDLGAGEGIGGFFLTEGEFIAVSRKEAGGRVLTFGGPGSLAYFSRAAMDAAPYVGSGIGEYNGPRDDMLWHWGQHSDLTFDKIGAILKRVIDEFQHVDRPTDPIPALTYDFDNDTDSATTAWDDLQPGGFTLAVGQNGLSCIEQFMRTGVTILAHPNLLLQAFTNEYGTDRSSATFAAGKVRWVHGTNIAVGTSGDVKHAIHESPRLRRLLVAGEGAIPATVVTVTDAGAPLEKEGFLSTTGSGTTYLTEIGTQDLALRAAETATAVFSHIPGENSTTGEYTPGWPGGAGYYWLGDTVRYHTGVNAFDFNEQNLRVAAISWKLRAGGDWEIVVELGSTYYAISQPKIAGVTAPGGGSGCVCPHPPSGGYEFGTPAVSDYMWTFDANEKDTTNTYPVGTLATNWHAGYVHAHVLHSGGVGNTSAGVKPPITPGTYHFRGIYSRPNGTPYNPGGVRMSVYSEDTFGTQTLIGTTAFTVGYEVMEDSIDVVVPADGVKIAFKLGYNSSTLFEVEISHGGGANDTFAGDDPPPASTLPGGSIGTDVGCYALCDHRHDPQAANDTPIVDAGAYFTGATVEEVLQEIGASIGEGGILDHGLLEGLGDDDHPQYLRTTDGGKAVINVVSASGSTETLNLADGNVHDVTLTANCTLTLTGATAGVACSMAILLRQDGTGSRTVTWPASVEWVGDTAPILQTAANAWDWVALSTLDGGTTWFGQHGGGTTELNDLTDVTITSPTEGQHLRYNGSAWVNATATFVGELLISDTPSTPLIFADLLQNEAEDNLLYADAS